MEPTGVKANLSVPDISQAREFYADYLGLSVEEFNMGWVARFRSPDGRAVVQLVTRDSVTPEHDGRTWSLIDLESDETRPAGHVELVVLAGPRRSLDELGDGLTAAQPDVEVVRIGDALAPRNLLDAAAEGARAARA